MTVFGNMRVSMDKQDGFRTGHKRAGGRAESRYIAQVVGIGVVERARRRAYFRLHGHDLARQPVGRAYDDEI